MIHNEKRVSVKTAYRLSEGKNIYLEHASSVGKLFRLGWAMCFLMRWQEIAPCREVLQLMWRDGLGLLFADNESTSMHFKFC